MYFGGVFRVNYLFNGISLQNGRQSNMDSLLLKSGLICGKTALLAVVCDGVGSLANGAFASGIAVKMLSEWFNNATTIDRIGMKMRDAILEINSHIRSDAKQNKIDTASTLSALLLVESDYYITHIGDSRVYCYEEGVNELSILTTDDISESGRLTACIGYDDCIFLQYLEGAATGKTFLVCSDGLYKRMDTDYMITKMKSWNKRSFKEPIEALPQYVVECGEQDNISIALAKIEDRGAF